MNTTDVFFAIGSTHKVCQDYARCGKDPSKPFAILSDGCSSAPDVDLGSRLVTLAAETQLDRQEVPNNEDLIASILLNLNIFQRTLQISRESLCATLMIANIVGNNFRTLCVGDGIVVAKAPDGFMSVREYTFESGAPYYLRYELDSEVKYEYFKEFEKEGKIQGERRAYSILPNGEVTEVREEPFTFGYESIYFEEFFPMNEWESVAIVSDGGHSFQKQQNTATSKTSIPVISSEILKELMSFKAYTGKFAQRRWDRASRLFKEKGIENSDDISMGVIAQRKDEDT